MRMTNHASRLTISSVLSDDHGKPVNAKILCRKLHLFKIKARDVRNGEGAFALIYTYTRKLVVG